VNSEVAPLARREKHVLLTRDTDFLNSDMFPPNNTMVLLFSRFILINLRLVKVTALPLEKVKDFLKAKCSRLAKVVSR